MKPKRSVPTDQELEILKVIWQRGQASVREVYNDLLKQREIAYTTVLTMTGILERKGHLQKTRGDRAYIYSPVESQDETQQRMVKEFVDRVFNGSAGPLLVHLVADSEISKAELAEVESMVKQKRKK
jgi:predicted transcriptional regulator